MVWSPFCLNPPHPSLTVREGARGPAALWSPAKGRNVGGTESLLHALPFGESLGLARGTLFPLRVRLTLGAPGPPGKPCCSGLLLSAHPGGICAVSRLSPFGPALLQCSCGAGTATAAVHGAAPCVTVVVPFGDALTFGAKRESYRGALGGTSCREALSLRDALTFGARRGSSKGALSVTACLKTLSPAGMRSRFEHIYMRARGGNDSGETPAT